MWRFLPSQHGKQGEQNNGLEHALGGFRMGASESASKLAAQCEILPHIAQYPFDTQISGRNSLPDLCGEVHNETAPFQDRGCALCSTEQSTFCQITTLNNDWCRPSTTCGEPLRPAAAPPRWRHRPRCQPPTWRWRGDIINTTKRRRNTTWLI